MLNLMEQFERNLATNECSPQTIRTYSDTARRLMTFVAENFSADFAADNVKGYMIDQWAASVADLKPSTRKLYYTGASRFLSFLYNAQYISFDLTPMIPKLQSLEKLYDKHPEARPNKGAYTIDQVQTMLRTTLRSRESTLRTHAMIAMLVSTGLRLFECLQLNVGDIGSDDVKIARKGTHGNLVNIVIPEQITEYTDPYLRFREEKGEVLTPESPLFVTNAGDRLPRREAQYSICSLEKKLGYHSGVHTFRHTALSMASRLGDPVTARDIAGQKNISVTNRYLHSTDEEKYATAERMAETFFRGSDRELNTRISERMQEKAALRTRLVQEFMGKGYGQGEAETLADMAVSVQ